MRKQEIIKKLKAKGLKTWKKKDADTHFYSKEIGEFTIYLDLSNQVRTFIETKGDGSYYIIMKDKRIPFSEVNESNIDDIFKLFNKRIKAVELFERHLL